MVSPQKKGAQDHELLPPTGYTKHDTQGLSYPDRHGESSSSGGRDRYAHVRDSSPTASPTRKLPIRPLGRPTVKKRFHALHVAAAGLSLICFALALAAVANERISWRLGVKNLQLIVVGFLLSIINLYLTTVTPTLFLQLEAKFGSSTLQNYDGILRNQVLSSKLDLVWRFGLGVMLALPLGLGVAYKTFTGGESVMNIDTTNFFGHTYYYGMFAPSGLQSSTGVSLFSNATLPFAVASSLKTGPEPPLPVDALASGFNVLSLNDESTAMLDIPEPSYVYGIQNWLAVGESWNITASVFATVATYNRSRTEDPRLFKSGFMSACAEAYDSSGAIGHMSMLNEFSIMLVNYPSPGNQSRQYIAITPDPGMEYELTCLNISHYAQPYDISRQLCKGTWSINRGSIRLVDGSCNNTVLSPEKQQLVTNNTLFPSVYYMSSLVELLGEFATIRNESKWIRSYMATGMAAMLWSRITILGDAAHPHTDGTPVIARPFKNLTYEEAGLVYPVNETVIYIRPTLRKSGLLYLVLAIQPLLIVIILVMAPIFHSMPLDRDFGLVSILSGVDRGSLDALAGAALSGKLASRVRLIMQPVQDDSKGTIHYHCPANDPTGEHMHNGRLKPNIVYH